LFIDFYLFLWYNIYRKKTGGFPMETIIYAINEIREEVEFVNANSPTIADADPTALITVGVVLALVIIPFVAFVIFDKTCRR
jgi:ABC-type phosphate transport system permease subunit